LKQEEENVRLEIERALEKENLDRERSMAGEASEGEDGAAAGSVKSSASLMGDLEEIRSKVDKYQAKRDLTEFPDVKENGEAVIACYKANLSTPLDCWREVNKFKASVANVEQQYFRTLQS
jgi:altered-inheritance-of-mitochondria protein 13